jgi:hypothetical protein
MHNHYVSVVVGLSVVVGIFGECGHPDKPPLGLFLNKFPHEFWNTTIGCPLLPTEAPIGTIACDNDGDSRLYRSAGLPIRNASSIDIRLSVPHCNHPLLRCVFSAGGYPEYLIFICDPHHAV